MNQKGIVVLVLVISISILLSNFTSAGMFDWLKQMTGEATTAPVNMNISIGNTAPQIVFVPAVSAVDLTLGPSITAVQINFTASDANGFGNLLDSTANVTLIKSGQTPRANASCKLTSNFAVTFANYSCTVNMQHWDGSGSWAINATVKDSSYANATNDTTSFTINSLTGFIAGPSSLAWPAISAGAVNQTASSAETLNNTGNAAITTGNIQINATHLKGEQTPTVGLWANNFSVAPFTGSLAECNVTATTMNHGVYAGITGATLSAGNYTINDGSTGQEQLYFCLRLAGSELTSQPYSTSNEGSWTIKIS